MLLVMQAIVKKFTIKNVSNIFCRITGGYFAVKSFQNKFRLFAS